MPMDWDGQQVFVTLEFPLGTEVRQAVTNSLSAEKEVRIYAEGELSRIVTARRISELKRDEQGNEIETRTYEEPR